MTLLASLPARRALALVASTALVASLAAAGAAQAAPRSTTAADLKGSWVGTTLGFAGKDEVNNQYWLKLTSVNGNVITGKQQWRPCEGRQKACRERSTKGGGWSKPERVTLAVLNNGTIAGKDLDGVISGYVQGDGSLELAYMEHQRTDGGETPLVVTMRLVPLG